MNPFETLSSAEKKPFVCQVNQAQDENESE